MARWARVPDKCLPLLNYPRKPGPALKTRSRNFFNISNAMDLKGPGPFISPS